MHTYYILAVKWTRNSDWTQEFGDYERKVVLQEAKDEYKGDCYAYRVCMTLDTQDSIQEKLDELNGIGETA